MVYEAGSVFFGLLWLIAAAAAFIYSCRTPGKLWIYIFTGLLGSSAMAFLGLGFIPQVVLGAHIFLIAIILGEIGPSDFFWLYFIITSAIFLVWYYWIR